MSFKCDTHGRIIGRGRPKFCPVCGGTLRNISPIPVLKLYVNKGDLLQSVYAIATILVVFGVTGLCMFGIKSCDDNELKEQQQSQSYKDQAWNSMGTVWRGLWVILDSTSSSQQVDSVQKYLSSHADECNRHRLDENQLSYLLKQVNTYDGTKTVSDLLGPYVSDSPTTKP